MIADFDEEDVEELRSTLLNRYDPHGSWRPLEGQELEAFDALGLEIRQKLVLELAPMPGGLHARVRTPSVADIGVRELLEGDRFIGTEILVGMEERHVVAALERRDALASGDVRMLSWALARGLADGGRVVRVETVESAVLDVVVVDEGVLASCRDGSLVLFSEMGRTALVPSAPFEKEAGKPVADPEERFAITPCRILAVTDEEVVRWGWESLIAVRRSDGTRAWHLELGHGLDGHDGECAVEGEVARLPDGSFIDLAANGWLPHERYQAQEERFRSAASTRREPSPPAWPPGLEPITFAHSVDTVIAGTKDGLVVWVT